MTLRMLEKMLLFLFPAAFVVVLVIGVSRMQTNAIDAQVTPVATTTSTPITPQVEQPVSTAGNGKNPAVGITNNTSAKKVTPRSDDDDEEEGGSSAPSTPTPAPQPAPTPTPTPAKQPTPTSATTQQYTGDSYRTPWGNVTVSITATNKKVTAIDTPSYPHSGPSVYAREELISQAIASGSANIQGVSGATYTSLAFAKSLESALAKIQ